MRGFLSFTGCKPKFGSGRDCSKKFLAFLRAVEAHVQEKLDIPLSGALISERQTRRGTISRRRFQVSAMHSISSIIPGTASGAWMVVRAG